MSDFNKLIKKLLIHEAFDKVYPLKNKRSYDSEEDVDRALEDSERDRSAEFQRKDYARNRMPWWEADVVGDRIHNRYDSARRNLEWEKQQAKSYKENLEQHKDITDKIIATALHRIGSPRKDIIQLDSIMEFAQTFAKIYKLRNEVKAYKQALMDYNRRVNSGDVTEDEPEPPRRLDEVHFKAIRQQFDGKGGRIEINIGAMLSVDEDLNLEQDPNFSYLDVAFSSARGGYGGYSTITGGGDAAQVVATVMEFAFAVFCVYEAAIKLLFPSFYKWKRNTNLNVIKFTPVENDSENMNVSSKSATEGTNKRGRLYTLGWERSMRKRVPDLELVTKGSKEHPIICIKYKENNTENSI